jgi:hypothetical protein
MKRMTLISLAALAIALPAFAESKPAACPAGDSDFAPIFDGKTLKGWHVSSKTGHGTGGKWVARDGAIVGSQDKPGNGGIVVTDEQYGDFEVSLDMGNDFGPDSGLFLRSTEDGKAYQALIDYHNDGNVMGVYGEGIGGWIARNYQMIGAPDNIRILDYPKFPAPFTPEEWKTIWKKDWNHVEARITGNPPRMETWINGLKIMDWTDTEKRLPDRGHIALQVHGGGDFTKQFVRYRNIRVRRLDAPDNTLTPEQKSAGWQLLFNGRNLDGWKTDKMQESKVPVDNGAIQTHGCGGYMMVPEKQFDNFILALDFKISKGCNSGIFVRTASLTPKPGWDVGYNGLEVQVLDSQGAGMQDMGAIYDLVPPCRNASRPVGEWNHAVITCDGPKIVVELNGEVVTRMNLDEWSRPSRRPDGSEHKFTGIAWKDHPRKGYIGLQDHGHMVWYKNIRILPLDR